LQDIALEITDKGNPTVGNFQDLVYDADASPSVDFDQFVNSIRNLEARNKTDPTARFL
jgi:hypothetical protein